LSLSQAVAALERGRFKDAERLAEHVRARGDQAAVDFLEALAAVRRASKAVRRWPRDAQAHLSLGQAYFLAEAGGAAMRAVQEALHLDPQLGEAHVLLGLEDLYQGRYEDACQAYERARSLLPAETDWLRALGSALEQYRVEHAPPAASPATGGAARLLALLRRITSRIGWFGR
jgi:tetratricopeptide (TPR) repeat protein